MADYPRFRFGEVVRVLHVPVYDDDDDGDADEPPVIGMEGVVTSVGPVPEPSGWSFGVWLPELERVWDFDDSDLESLGLVELEEGEPKGRVPLDPATHVESFAGEIGIGLQTEVSAEDATAVAERAEEELRNIMAVERITWTGEVHWDTPYRYVITLKISPRGEPRAAFEKLVASQRTGWVRQVDDGWSTDFWWSEEAAGGQSFLVDEAWGAKVWLTPWSDPSFRPVKRGRTHDPGLPGYTPPPPPAGYEP